MYRHALVSLAASACAATAEPAVDTLWLDTLAAAAAPLSMAEYEVAIPEVDIDWCSVTTGLGGLPIDPMTARVWAFGLPYAAEEAAWMLATGEFSSWDATSGRTVENATDACHGRLGEMVYYSGDSAADDPLLVFVLGDEDYATALAEPLTSAILTEVVLPAVPAALVPDWCERGVQVLLDAPVTLPVVDWSGVTSSAHGRDFDPWSVTGVELVRVEAGVCDDLLGGLGYAATVAITESIPLDALRHDGVPFPGLGAGETWRLLVRAGEYGVPVGVVDIRAP